MNGNQHCPTVWGELTRNLNTQAAYTQDRLPGPDGLRYKLIESLPVVETFSSQWDYLLERSACNCAFSCSAWFLAVCRHDPAIAPMLFTAWRNEELAGVFPLTFHKDDASIGFASPLSDYNDLIAATDDVAVQTGLLNFVLHVAGSRHLVLAEVRPDSNCVRAAEALAVQCGMTFVYDQCRTCLFIRLPGTFEEYLASRSRQFRKGLHRIQREAAANHLVIRLLTGQTFDPSQLAELFLSLNRGRFGKRSRFGVPPAESILKELVPKLFLEDRLYAFVLLDAGKAVAIDLCMRGPSSLCTWNGGFLPEATHWSPGRLLMAAEIQHAFTAKLEEFDLLRGSHLYKTSWATESRTSGNLSFGSGVG